MIDNVEDLQKKALDNKIELKKKYITIPIGDEEYEFRISGIGNKSIKIENYVKYEDIIEAIENGNNNGLEAIINQFVDEYDDENEEEE